MSGIEKKGVIWNVLGSVANASASIVLLLVVTRICGTETAGVFSIAFVTAQMFMNLGNYGVRAYQVSDKYEVYSFKEYEWNRYITCFIMLLAVFGFVCIRGYDFRVGIVVMLMGIWKMLDAMADVYEGRLQQKNRLDLAGESLFFRTIAGVICFCFVIWITNSLIYAGIWTIVISALLLFVLAWLPVSRMKTSHKRLKSFNVLRLLAECFPLFFSLSLLAYIINVPKYAIEQFMSYDEQTYYNIIYMPAQVIYLLAAFAFKPFLTNLTEVYHESVSQFKKKVFRFVLLTGALTSVVMLVCFFIGIPILEILFGVELKPYKSAFIIVLLGGGFNAVSSFLYFMLAIMRRQRVTMVAYICGVFTALLSSEFLVKSWGIEGAAVVYCISMFVIALITMVSMSVLSRKREG